MSIIFDFRGLNIKDMRSNTIGNLVKMTKLLNTDNSISKGKKIIDSNYLAKFLNITINNLNLTLKELIRLNIVKECDNDIMHINPKYMRHDKFDNSEYTLNLFVENKIFYVYRFLDASNNVIYIGKTERLKSRMHSHSHLPKECYDSIKNVEYIELSSSVDMGLYELYYINKWQPTYNSLDKQINQQCNIPIREHIDSDWKKYRKGW